MNIASLNAPLGAEVSGIDLTQPLDSQTVEALRAAWLDHVVLVFRRQNLTAQQLLAFARRFGDLEFPPSKLLNYSQGSGQKADIPPEINVISNVVENGKKIGQLGAGEARWHTDSSFVAKPPSASVLHALELPPSGGNTSFMNMYAALDGLPADLRRRIDGARCKHDCSHTSDGVLRNDFAPSKDVSECPGPSHPLIRTHPESGRQSLYLGRRLNAYIEGLSVADSEALLDELWGTVSEMDIVYEHVWRDGDVLMWDNRCAMHRREAFDPAARRIMYRSQVQGDMPA